MTREEVMQIPELLKQGLTTSQIAQKFGVSHSTIVRWKRELRRVGYDVPVGKKGRLPTLSKQITNEKSVQDSIVG